MLALVVFCLLFVLPLVLGSIAILTEHQRKMATLRLAANGDDRIAALERRVAELAMLVHEQTIALDGLGPRQSPAIGFSEIPPSSAFDRDAARS